MIEQSEAYEVLVNKLNSMGPIKKIINNPVLIDMVLSYNGDRHFTQVFFMKISDELANGNLTDDDMKFLRSSYLIRRMINLDECVFETKGRGLYKNELGDKIGYLPYIQDEETLINSLTSREMAKVLFDDSDNERANVIRYKVNTMYDDLPRKVQLSIVSEALLHGKGEIADELIKRVNDEKFRSL